MPTPNLGASYLTVSAMITPALFMTATSSLIISTSNRMSRIVDRIRSQIDLADRLDRGLVDVDYPDARLAHLEDQMDHLEERSDRVRTALTLLYLALSAFVGTSLALAADTTLGSRLPALPTALAVLGVGLLFAATVNLTREARRALRSNRQEVRFHHDLRARRRDDRPSGN